jgi:hypothetical protein
MQNKRVIHCSYFLLTTAMFVVGSQFAELPSSGSVLPKKEKPDPFVKASPIQEISALAGAEKPTASPGQNDSSAGQGDDGQPLLLSLPVGKWNGKGLRFEDFALEKGPLSEGQIEELVLAAIKSSDPVERRRAFDRILQEMQQDSFTVEQAMTIRKAMANNQASGEQWRDFDYAWGANDPEAAVAYIEQIPERYRNGYTGNMLPGLASVEPQIAIDLVAEMEGDLQRRMTGRLIEGLADNDIGVATEYVFGLAENEDPHATQHMRKLAREVVDNEGLEGGLSWAENLEEGPLQGAALWQVANEFTNEDPEAASQWAEQFVGQDQNARLFGEVVREWDDREAAEAWVASLEPSQGQRDALSAVFGFKGAHQPHEAVQEIIDMPVSQDRDFAINGFISGLAVQDGESAVIWAAEISDPGMRQAAMIRAGRHFFRQDQQAAMDWFAASDLPEASLSQMAGVKVD